MAGRSSCRRRVVTRRKQLGFRSDNFGAQFSAHDLAGANKKSEGKIFEPTDPTRPPSSTRAFLTRVRRRACVELALPTLGRGLHLGERVHAGLRAAARRGRPVAATAKVAILPILLE